MNRFEIIEMLKEIRRKLLEELEDDTAIYAKEEACFDIEDAIERLIDNEE